MVLNSNQGFEKSLVGGPEHLATSVGRSRKFIKKTTRRWRPPPWGRERGAGQGFSQAAVQALAYALEAKDPYTSEHSIRVRCYAVAMARIAGWRDDKLEGLGVAAEVHDIGKIAVPLPILHKNGPLTKEEYAQIMIHTEAGARILEPVFPEGHVAIDVVRWHHERIDGRGPGGLKGSEIPLAAKLVCVADAFDAMTTTRPYRRPLTPNNAVLELNKYAGKQFDRVCVELLEEILPKEDGFFVLPNLGCPTIRSEIEAGGYRGHAAT